MGKTFVGFPRMRRNHLVSRKSRRNNHTLHLVVMLLLYAALNQRTHVHANTSKMCQPTSHTWSQSASAVSELYKASLSSSSPCFWSEARMWGEEDPDKVPEVMEGEEQGKAGGGGGCTAVTLSSCVRWWLCVRARHLSDWRGGWGWGEGKRACGWGCTTENTGVARVHQHSFFICAHRDCSHMQIYKHSGINQKRILSFRQTAALCRDHHWKPPSHAPILPFFNLPLSLSLGAPFHSSEHAPSFPIPGQTPSTPPTITIPHPRYPVLTKPT